MGKVNTFLDKGHNRLILKIIDAVVIVALSIVTLYFVVNMLGASTSKNYLGTVFHNLVFFLAFGIVDFLIVLFTKPLYGFTSFIDNHKARKALKAKEKAAKAQQDEAAKETMIRAKAEQKERTRKRIEAAKK